MPKFEVIVVTEYTVTVEADNEQDAHDFAVESVSFGDYDESFTQVESMRELPNE